MNIIIVLYFTGGVKGLPFIKYFLLKTKRHISDPWEELIWAVHPVVHPTPPILSSLISLYIYELLVTVRVRCARDL
jgi:hypothetical protein